MPVNLYFSGVDHTCPVCIWHRNYAWAVLEKDNQIERERVNRVQFLIKN